MSLQSNYTAFAARRAAERTEDLRWMIETGESMVGAAARLGISPDSLERWCERRGLRAEAVTLRSRNPIDPDMDPSERGRRGAAARWEQGDIKSSVECRACRTLAIQGVRLRDALGTAARRAANIRKPETPWAQKVFVELSEAQRELAAHEEIKASHDSGHESEWAS